jgi:hypothetical protein
MEKDCKKPALMSLKFLMQNQGSATWRRRSLQLHHRPPPKKTYTSEV